MDPSNFGLLYSPETGESISSIIFNDEYLNHADLEYLDALLSIVEIDTTSTLNTKKEKIDLIVKHRERIALDIYLKEFLNQRILPKEVAIEFFKNINAGILTRWLVQRGIPVPAKLEDLYDAVYILAHNMKQIQESIVKDYGSVLMPEYVDWPMQLLALRSGKICDPLDPSAAVCDASEVCDLERGFCRVPEPNETPIVKFSNASGSQMVIGSDDDYNVLASLKPDESTLTITLDNVISKFQQLGQVGIRLGMPQYHGILSPESVLLLRKYSDITQQDIDFILTAKDIWLELNSREAFYMAYINSFPTAVLDQVATSLNIKPENLFIGMQLAPFDTIAMNEISKFCIITANTVAPEILLQELFHKNDEQIAAQFGLSRKHDLLDVRSVSKLLACFSDSTLEKYSQKPGHDRNYQSYVIYLNSKSDTVLKQILKRLGQPESELRGNIINQIFTFMLGAGSTTKAVGTKAHLIETIIQGAEGTESTEGPEFGAEDLGTGTCLQTIIPEITIANLVKDYVRDDMTKLANIVNRVKEISGRSNISAITGMFGLVSDQLLSNLSKTGTITTALDLAKAINEVSNDKYKLTPEQLGASVLSDAEVSDIKQKLASANTLEEIDPMISVLVKELVGRGMTPWQFVARTIKPALAMQILARIVENVSVFSSYSNEDVSQMAYWSYQLEVFNQVLDNCSYVAQTSIANQLFLILKTINAHIFGFGFLTQVQISSIYYFVTL